MINTTNVQLTAVTKRYSTTAPFSDWKVACFRKCEGHFLMVFSSCLHLKQQILGCYYGYIFQSVSVSRVVKVWVGKERERENENTPRERSVIFSISTWAEQRPSTCTSHQTHIPPLMNLWLTPSPTLLSRSVISVFAPPHSHKRSHVAWYKSPAAERTRKKKRRRQMSNIKHTHCTYTADTPDLQQRLLRPNMWKATCVQAWQPSAHAFKLLLIKIASASLFWADSGTDRKPEEKKNRKQLVSTNPSNLQLTGKAVVVVVNNM